MDTALNCMDSASIYMLDCLACAIGCCFKIDAEGDRLCENCSKLDLSPSSSDFGPSELHLGTFSQICDRYYCPFCRLIVDTFGPRNLSDQPLVGPLVLKWNAKRSFYLDNIFFADRRIVFVDKESEIPLSPHLAGRIITNLFDTDLVKRWVRVCEEHHSLDCDTEKNVIATPEVPGALRFLRLIDVQDQCLVEAAPGCRYMALSYVWGTGKSVFLLRKNKSQLMKPNGFLSINKDLPRTIADAMTLVLRTGERYLWVDSLCLVQDDNDDKMDGIQKMDLIYRGAFLTIVAASGSDNGAGLPGLHPETRNVNQIVKEVRPGVEMTVVTALFTPLSERVYMTRGWTFQEFILSPRCLIFLPDRVHFLCRKSVWSEETIYERFPSESNEATGTSARVERPRFSDANPYATFVQMLFRYGERRFTVESDILNGMLGILNTVCLQLKSDHLEGLITSCFDLSLLHWNYLEPKGGKGGGRRGQFPSWSWTGWTSGPVGFVPVWENNQDHGEWLEKETYIVWYRRSPKRGSMEFVWNPDQSTSTGKLGIEGTYYNPRQQSHLFSSLSYDPNSFPTQPTQELLWKEIPRDYTILQFWAHTITIFLHKQSLGRRKLPGERRALSVIYDDHNHLCGSMLVDDLAVAEKAQKEATKYEAIILSKANSCKTFGKTSDLARADKPLYWLMLIERDGGFAERKGLGFIYQNCISPSSLSEIIWKEIVLA